MEGIPVITPNFEGRELTQQECYQAGYEQGKRDAVPEDIRKDAERYRWIRENDWFKHAIVVLAPYERTAHETDVYLDAAIDAAIAAAPKEK